ncbi:UDP-N-acetylmuramoyl-tripeptide--D-alanyl-D-alanine ligase [Candidatus Palauibacter sp.]|uniref:UDP-N-acetylmuramoyl-tripeptide--D-alanyl-D- alanine ligase n=1 Tax=Candidatus Palauibacter sp. TaxID=3101350 RepID=UPI003B5CEC82
MSAATHLPTLRSGRIRCALGLGAQDGEERAYAGVSSDSRTLKPGELFVALAGERHDAADFLPQAAARGASGAIVRAGRENPALPLEYFSVPDPLQALGDLAAGARRDSAATVVAITGSSGKTTVKEMVACALSEVGRVYRTEGNLNSQVGLPLTILRAPPDADTWVLEVGASEPGEIGRLAEIARPDHVVITTVGAAHLEFFGDVTGVLREKMRLAQGASGRGALIVGEEPDVLPAAARAHRADAIVAGIGPGADFAPDEYVAGPDRIEFRRGEMRVSMGVGGEHHLRDALIAAAVAEALEVPPAAAARGLSRYQPLGMRGAIRRIGRLTVLADCYNANPDSFRAAIAQVRRLLHGRRGAVFAGSMLELGPEEARAHRDIGDELQAAGFDVIAATGLFRSVPFDGASARSVIRAEDPATAIAAFGEALAGDEVVLVKGSRGARLERVIDDLEARFGGRT